MLFGAFSILVFVFAEFRQHQTINATISVSPAVKEFTCYMTEICCWNITGTNESGCYNYSIQCRLPSIPYSSQDNVSTTVKYLQTVNVLCQYGYVINVTNNRSIGVTCRDNETLSIWPFSCTLVTCFQPPIPHSNRSNFIKTVVYASYETVTCDNGYQINGTSDKSITFTCQANATLSKWPFSCSPVQCPRLSIGNATINTTNSYFPTYVEVTCNTGYVTDYFNYSKTAVIRCNETAQWSGDVKCQPVTCEIPRIPYSSQDNVTVTVTYLQTIIVSCKYGYLINVTNNQSVAVTCNENRTVSMWPFSCTPVRCDLPSIQFSSTYSSATGNRVSKLPCYYPQTCLITCNAGYHFINTSDKSISATCRANATLTFSVWPVWCTPVQCPSLSITNATINTTSSYFPTYVEVRCDTGYVIDYMNYLKTAAIRCNETAQWSDDISCQPVTCEIPRIPYSSQDNVTVTVTYLQTIIVSCQYGYVINVTNNPSIDATCQENRTVSMWPFSCTLVTCFQPPIPHSNRSNFIKTVVYASYETVTCDNGYQINGTSDKSITFTCQANATLSKWPFSCSPVQCPSLSIANATNNASNFDFPAYVEVTCDAGYVTDYVNYSKKAVIRCNETAQWSDDISCQPVECILPPVTFSSHDNVSTTVVYEYNLDVWCAIGYLNNVTGRQLTTVACQANATWSDWPFSCVPVQCPALTMANSTYNVTSYDYLEYVEVTCDVGYVIDFIDRTTTTWIYCNETAQWSPDISCQPIYCSLNSLKSMQSGCNCEASDAAIDAESNGNWSFYGTIFTYGCLNYSMKFSNGAKFLNVSCGIDGRWSPADANCDYGRCGPVPTVPYAKPNTTLALPGTVVAYTCIDGYKFSRGRYYTTIQCDGKTWSQLSNTCEPVYCSLGSLFAMQNGCNCFTNDIVVTAGTSGNKSAYNTWLKYRCSTTGMKNRYGWTSYSVYCNANGDWYPANINCTYGVCDPVPVVWNAYSNTTLALMGTVVEYTCYYGYRFSDRTTMKTISCDGTSWSSINDACRAVQCTRSALIAMQSGCNCSTNYLALNKYRVSDYWNEAWVVFRCSGASNFSDGTKSRKVYCSETGNWSPTDVVCYSSIPPAVIQMTSSLQPNVELNAIESSLASSTMAASTTVSTHPAHITTAATNAAIVGTPDKATTTSDQISESRRGEDVPEPTVTSPMQRLDCPDPIKLRHADVQIYRSSGGTTAVYQCHPGYKFPDKSTSRSLNCVNNNWHTQIEECIAINCDGTSIDKSIYKSVTDEISTGKTIDGSCVKAKSGQQQTLFDNGASTKKIKCVAKGKKGSLSADPSDCRVGRCKPPPLVYNATISMNDKTRTVTIYCKAGYRLRDGRTSMKLQCYDDGTWDDAGHCSPMSCPAWTPTDNCALSTTDVIYGTVLVVTCTRGYMIPNRSRSVTVKCITYGVETPEAMWNDTMSGCVPVSCDKIPLPSDSTTCSTDVKSIQPDPTTKKFPYETPVQYTCIERLKFPDGHTSVTSQCGENGQWTLAEEDLVCSANVCDPVPDVQFATPSTRRAINGTKVVYTCRKAYKFSSGLNTASIKCNGQVWSKIESSCSEYLCPKLSFRNAEWTAYNRSYQSTVNVTCLPGYRMSDIATSDVLTCQADGIWSFAGTSICNPVDCGPAPQLKGAIPLFTKSAPTTYTAAPLVYGCMDEFWFARMKLTTKASCLADGTWSVETGLGELTTDTNDWPSCRRVTCYPMSFLYEVNTTSNSIHTIAEFRCPAGQNFTNNPDVDNITAVCQPSGEWIPNVPECKAMKTQKFKPVVTEAKHAESIVAVSIVALTVGVVLLILLDRIGLQESVSLLSRNLKVIFSRE